MSRRFCSELLLDARLPVVVDCAGRRGLAGLFSKLTGETVPCQLVVDRVAEGFEWRSRGRGIESRRVGDESKIGLAPVDLQPLPRSTRTPLSAQRDQPRVSALAGPANQALRWAGNEAGRRAVASCRRAVVFERPGRECSSKVGAGAFERAEKLSKSADSHTTPVRSGAPLLRC